MAEIETAKLFNLQGRVIAVTGGGRGLGRELSEGLAASGASLVIIGRDPRTLAAAACELKETYGATVAVYPCDLANRNSVNEVGAAILGDSGRVDCFVHNAGYEGLEPIEKVSEATLDKILETNLVSAILLSRAFVPRMKENKWGRLIFVTSATTSASSVEGHSVYTASKCALEGLARTLAVELGSHGVTANCIAPGTFLTDQAQGVLDSLGREQGDLVYKAFASMSAAGRWGEPRELVGLLLLLCSEVSSFITGETIRVDGGLAIKLRPS